MLADSKILRQIEKAVFLRANDTLWVEHIDTVTQLRENVAFSGYAQKDPLIEYKTQAFQLFTTLLEMIRTNTVTTLFKVDIAKSVPIELLKKNEEKNMQTNADEVEAQLSGGLRQSTQSSDNPVVVRVDSPKRRPLAPPPIQEKVGRNEPCPCKSGKKYKKCCGANL